MNQDHKAVGNAYLKMLAESNIEEKMSSKEKMAKGLYNSKMDPVGAADADIDNDGDVDKSDEYLHKKRKAIKKSMKKSDDSETDTDPKLDEASVIAPKKAEKELSPGMKRIARALAGAKGKAQPKDKVSLAKAPFDIPKEQKEARSWPIYARIQEKVGYDMPPADKEHTKGATDPEMMKDKLTPSDKKFVDAHGGIDGNDSGIDGDKAAQQTMDAIKNSVKAGPARRNDNTNQEDKMEVPKDTTKAGGMREALDMVNEYKAHGNYDPHQGNDEGITAGKGKLDKQYHKAEAHVKSKHGSGGYAYAHHKGDTAVSAMTGDESSPYSHKEGSSSLGNHDTHNITAVVHKDGSTSAVNLKYGHRATHHDVMKQAPKVHHSLAKKIAVEHNSAAAKVTD